MNEFLVGLFFTANGILIFIFEMPIVYWIEETKKYFSNLAIGAILIGIGFFCLAPTEPRKIYGCPKHDVFCGIYTGSYIRTAGCGNNRLPHLLVYSWCTTDYLRDLFMVYERVFCQKVNKHSYFLAGKTFPRTSPKPTRIPFFSACPLMITVS